MPQPIPQTPPPGPPNFYSQAGAMAAGQGGSPQQGQPGAAGAGGQPGSAAGPGQNSPQDQEFLDNMTKLLGILDKMSSMKPKGQDVSQFMQAAAAPLKDCAKQVFKQDLGMPGQTAADGSVADTATAGAAAPPSAAGGGAPGPDTGTS